MQENLEVYARAKAAQQVAGADLAVENPFEAGLAFAALQVKFGHAVPAARRLSSTVSPLQRKPMV